MVLPNDLYESEVLLPGISESNPFLAKEKRRKSIEAKHVKGKRGCVPYESIAGRNPYDRSRQSIRFYCFDSQEEESFMETSFEEFQPGGE
ncbi:MAG: hypothetical protein WC178_02255 [Candidatus Paceibacterota bacterium]